MLQGPAHGYRYADVDAKHQTLLPLTVNAANASRSIDLTSSTLTSDAINTPIPATLAYHIGTRNATVGARCLNYMPSVGNWPADRHGRVHCDHTRITELVFQGAHSHLFCVVSQQSLAARSSLLRRTPSTTYIGHSSAKVNRIK